MIGAEELRGFDVSARAVQRLETELRRCLDLLITHYRPLRILLFGSLAQGRAGEYSDIDLIIIKRTEKRFLDRIAEVLRLIKPREAMDVLVYTPEEFEQLCRERLFFKEEILKKAKVLYDAQRSAEVDDALPGSLPEGMPTREDAESALWVARKAYEMTRRYAGKSEE